MNSGIWMSREVFGILLAVTVVVGAVIHRMFRSEVLGADNRRSKGATA